MQAKLDMGAAWDKATAILAANRQVIMVVAGVFFFLPNVIAALLLPPSDEFAMQMQAMGNQPDPQEMMAVLSDFWAQSWWVYLLVGIVQTVGTLGLLALLTDRARPTVGEALAFGAKGVVPYFAAQILLGIGLGLAFLLLVALGALIHPAVAVVLALMALVGLIYAWVKFSLLAPVMAIEKTFNPIAALARSWKLTKGNSLRLFAFYVLLMLVIVIVSLVASMVIGLFAVLGETAGLIGAAIGGGLISMAVSTIMLCVLAAVHAQLSGGAGRETTETFS